MIDQLRGWPIGYVAYFAVRMVVSLGVDLFEEYGMGLYT
jgi:hypothetical protein